MVKQYQRSLPELLDAYRDYLYENVSKVRILGEADERELKDVFVELSIVDQRAPQQHAEFLGLMDSVMRRRFNPFADVDRDEAPEMSDPLNKETNRRVRPDELLRCRTKAIITGAPGCGKTTLLKYLALQANEQGRLAVWIELKAIDSPLFTQAEAAAARSGHLMLPELWLRHLQAQLSLSAAEIKLLHAHWQEQFKANEITVLLDGFDELRGEAIERSLNKCIGQFTSALHDNTLLISTRPYAQARLGHERLQELEIEPLNRRQIEAFLNCYYPNDAAIKSLLKTLRERSSVRELLHVPLLLGVVLRLHRENSFTDDQLKLYETIIANLIHKLDRSKSVNRQFRISDEELRLDFLKFLAFERLLCDQVEQETKQIVFSYDLLKEKARTFLAQECSYHNPRDLANDALATPLLREVGADIYSFTHLTLQEYMAARAFAAFYQKKGNEFESLKIFCRAYHNPMIVEMAVLPMMLGALSNADKLYAEIERWPESLSFSNLRLRAHGLAFRAKIRQERLLKLIERLFEFISVVNRGEAPYWDIVINSFIGAGPPTLSLIEGTAASPANTNPRHLFNVADALGRLGSKKAVEVLMSALKDGETSVRKRAAWTLGEIGLEQAVEALTSALTDNDSQVRRRVVEALGKLGSEQAITALNSALNDDENTDDVRWRIVEALGKLGEEAVEALSSALSHPDPTVRWRAAVKLGKLGSEKAVEALISALNHCDRTDHDHVTSALGETGSEQAIETLIVALNHDNVWIRWSAARSLGEIGSKKTIAALISALNHDDSFVRWYVIRSLSEIASEQATAALVSALNDDDVMVRLSAAAALGKLGLESAVEVLISALNDDRSFVRLNAAAALGKLGSEQAIEVLILALNHHDSYVRSGAAEALGEVHSALAIGALISALDDNDSHVRQIVVAALGKLSSEQVVAPLISALSDDNYSVRFEAVMVLGRLGAEQAVEALTLVLNEREDYLGRITADALAAIESEQAVEALISTLNHRATYIRTSVAEALGAIGSDQAVAALILALNHDDGNVSWTAAWALARMTAETLTLGLAHAIKHHDAFARKKAVLVIGYYSDDERTLEQLKHLSQTDENHAVREAARDATEKFARKLELLDKSISTVAPPPLPNVVGKEGVLVHEVGLIVAAAGHFFREVLKYDEGIDGEIEFRDAKGRGSGQRVYLQLKSGDSYLMRQKSGKEIFRIKKPRHAQYWCKQPCPVLLVIRDSKGRIRWMNVTEYLQHHGTNIKQIEFKGEPLTAESVREMPVRFAR